MSSAAILRVKLSTENAGSIALTPVVVREMTLAELLAELLPVTGKDLPRIRETLQRGSFTFGATRFRWPAFEAAEDSLRALLATFPDADPQRAFDPGLCTHAVLRSPVHRVELPREALAMRRIFRRSSFWRVLMEAASAARLHYVEYSYRDRADRYRFVPTPDQLHHLRAHAHLIRYSTLARQLRHSPIQWIEFLVTRPPA
jgi:hypothetical protein